MFFSDENGKSGMKNFKVNCAKPTGNRFNFKGRCLRSCGIFSGSGFRFFRNRGMMKRNDYLSSRVLMPSGMRRKNRKEVSALAELELPGNETVAARLREAAERGTLAHALLFTGSGDRMAAALFAAAAFQCTGKHTRPCGACAGCRKVREGIHPDVTVVQDTEHKNIAVDVIRQVRADAYIRPNEGGRKVYLFPDCAILTETDQNVLLKVVEEGPPYAAFLFCAENPAAVLPTLRSRCVELKLRPAGEAERTLSEDAQALCRAIGGKKRGSVAEVLVRLEKSKCTREGLQTLLEETYGAFAAALLAQYGRPETGNMGKTAASLAKNLTRAQIMGTIEILQNYRQQCQYNVSAGQTLGALTVELEGIL